MTNRKKNPTPLLDGVTDFLTRNGADALVKHLTDYWTSRGYRSIRVERYELPGTVGGSYGVRSNMVGGIPPGGKAGKYSVKLDVRGYVAGFTLPVQS